MQAQKVIFASPAGSRVDVDALAILGLRARREGDSGAAAHKLHPEQVVLARIGEFHLEPLRSMPRKVVNDG